MKKILFMFVGILCSLVTMAADAISCSVVLTSDNMTQTNCTSKYFNGSNEAAISGTKSGDYYYFKMNGDGYFYAITLDQGDYNRFKAGDVVTVKLWANGTTVGYKVGSVNKTAVSESATKSTYKDVAYTLKASDIESDGTLRIYRNSSNSYVASITVTGTREASSLTESDFTLTSDNSLTMSIGDESQITYTSSSDGAVTYAPVDSKVVSVSTTGKVSALAAGVTTINIAQAETSTYEAGNAAVSVLVPYAADKTSEVLKLDNTNYGFSSGDSKSYYFKNGLKITNPAAKTYGYASIDNNNGMKFSAGTTYTIVIPDGVTVYSATIKARNNYDTGNNEAQLGNFFGKTFTDNLPFSSQDAIEETFNFAEGATGSELTFTPAGNQIQLIIELSTVDPAVKPTTIFSMKTKATSDQNTSSTSTDFAEMTAEQVTVTGGSASVGGATGKKFIGSKNGYQFCIGSNSLAFYITLDEALAVGDILSFDGIEGNEISFTSNATRATDIATTNFTYTIKEDDGLAGGTELYLWRATSNTTYFNNFKITRPATVATPTIGTNGYSTYCSDYAFTVTGATAYKATMEGETVTLVEIEGAVPAGEGVVLKGEEGATATLLYAASAPAVEGNILKGVNSETTEFAAGANYVLASNGTKTAFVKMAGGKTVAEMMNKAYLNVTSAGAKPVIFIDDDDATAADAVEAAQENVVSVKKFFKNGQLLIETANGLVNAAGAQVK